MVNVTSTEMALEWQNTDRAAESVYHMWVQSANGSRETNSSQETIFLSDLHPGTPYNISISPVLGQVWGDSSSIMQYIRESLGHPARTGFPCLSPAGGTVK